MDALDFAFHKAHYERLFGGNEATRASVIREAKRAHVLVVHDTLRDVFYSAATLAQSLTSADAKSYMAYGVGRRLRMMWTSYREITGNIDVDRTQPLQQKEVGSVSRDLNNIYINVVGVLDNYAWCLRHQKASNACANLPNQKIGLFSADLMRDPNLIDLKTTLEPFRAWHQDLKTRRDPAAHRIPLSVPPTLLSEDEADVYRDLENRIAAAMRNLEFQEIDRLREQQDRLGKCLSYFYHHPNEAMTPIYPTVPQDIAEVVRICKHVNSFLSAV